MDRFPHTGTAYCRFLRLLTDLERSLYIEQRDIDRIESWPSGEGLLRSNNAAQTMRVPDAEQRILPKHDAKPGSPGEYHLGMPHYDINYHPVYMLDLARLWRCFTNEDLAVRLDYAIGAVTESSLQKYRADAKKRHFSLIVPESSDGRPVQDDGSAPSVPGRNSIRGKAQS